MSALVVFVCVGSAAAQEKVFEWQRGTEESVRLDPSNYHGGKSYSSQGGTIHVDIDAQQPVSIFMTSAGEWNRAMQNPELLGSIRTVCLREHVVKVTYTCDLPREPMQLIVRDDRETQSSKAFAGLGAVLKSTEAVATAEPQLGGAMGVINAVGSGVAGILGRQSNATSRHFVAPNDVHIQYYRWICVSNCFPPEFQWIQQAKEEYKLTPFLKVYGGYAPDHDGELVSVKIKAPVPMLVAVVPASVANQLHAKPDMLEPALEKTACQQRGVQSQTFQCTFNAADGPQSLIVVPENLEKVPHKKTEVEFFASKCVANCALPPQNAEASVNPNP
ncbi:MAG TPA: hypothetical protein VMJ35_10910 [Dongiaceae bacterium]|nr:hypothetical protein [Dongiaceae bacterium]